MGEGHFLSGHSGQGHFLTGQGHGWYPRAIGESERFKVNTRVQGLEFEGSGLRV